VPSPFPRRSVHARRPRSVTQFRGGCLAVQGLSARTHEPVHLPGRPARAVPVSGQSVHLSGRILAEAKQVVVEPAARAGRDPQLLHPPYLQRIRLRVSRSRRFRIALSLREMSRVRSREAARVTKLAPRPPRVRRSSASRDETGSVWRRLVALLLTMQAEAFASVGVTVAMDDQQACRLALAPRLLSRKAITPAPARQRHGFGHKAVAPYAPRECWNPMRVPG
jgi:hypothetical protein